MTLAQSYASRIRNRDGRLPDLLYRGYKGAERLDVMPFPLLHHLLSLERHTRPWAWMRGKFYDEPLFKLECASYGKGLRLVDGIPEVYGHLALHLGEHVTLHGASTLVGAKVFEHPSLRIGNCSHCGSQFTALVGADIVIGDHVLIANRVSLLSYDSHPLDYRDRRRGLPAPAHTSRPIRIEDDVWICPGAYIMKGVTIGRGAIVAAGAVVTRDVAPSTVVAGNPARCVKTLKAPPETADA